MVIGITYLAVLVCKPAGYLACPRCLAAFTLPLKETHKSAKIQGVLRSFIHNVDMWWYVSFGVVESKGKSLGIVPPSSVPI